ncbi:septal ring factor EnvC (AmiA/AmiB activator) [Lewinella marina]|uniref:SPOR domain-containing protein n=1 Tax=Neolewinella marina TaxID=438751 RepID=A0A2G0CEL8_9BACT|nr:hypothetical protein [Neolewinella marina]NJB87248.1 septal ring factor EnvC (AmiA/AmiB activator) [Neolewinella marina]PHK98426.1 hypothetical protein CGL56_12095 [Neolewinella marina]
MQQLNYLLLLSVVLLVGCSPKVAPVIGEDGTDWNARAAEYRQNPAALRDLVEDCERSQSELVGMRQQLSSYESEAGNLQNQLSTAEASAEQAYQEIQQLRQEIATLEANQRPDEVITDQPQVKGVIFQVQLGAYAQNRVDPNMATGDALDLTDQNGLQKVVVSRFRTYQNAANLRDRLKQMGVKDAFVVAMNDGQRIDVQQAIKLSGQN